MGPGDEVAGLILALPLGSGAVIAIVVAMREAPGSHEMAPGAGDSQLAAATACLTDG
jgi:hypothetical protein